MSARRSSAWKIWSQCQGAPLIVVLDSIEDPHNVGAILRTVDAAGADGVVRQSRHAAPLGGAAAKASAGAVAHVKVAEVVNIARALETAESRPGSGRSDWRATPRNATIEMDCTLPTAVVVGGEGTGLRRLVRERCDWLASIPMRGHVESLNVSVATGIALFEAVRQRRSEPSRIEGWAVDGGRRGASVRRTQRDYIRILHVWHRTC